MTDLSKGVRVSKNSATSVSPTTETADAATEPAGSAVPAGSTEPAKKTVSAKKNESAPTVNPSAVAEVQETPTPSDEDEQRPANVTDAGLWRLVKTVRERHKQSGESCAFCGEGWPCVAEQRAELADRASRRPITSPAPVSPAPVVPVSTTKAKSAGPVTIVPKASEPVEQPDASEKVEHSGLARALFPGGRHNRGRRHRRAG